MKLTSIIENEQKAIVCKNRRRAMSVMEKDYFIAYQNPQSYRLIGEIFGQLVFKKERNEKPKNSR